MSLENFRYVFYPLGVQTAISYITAQSYRAHAQLAFVCTLAFFNIPIIFVAIWYRISGHEWALFMEMWLNCALIVQSTFYYCFEMQTNFSPTQWMALVIVFMNEITFYGGNWFGHQEITFICVFFICKVLASTSKYGEKIWPSLVFAEFTTMCALPIVYLCTSPSVVWFVPAFLVTVPLSFPTSNALMPPSAPQRGLISVAPELVLLADE